MEKSLNDKARRTLTKENPDWRDSNVHKHPYIRNALQQTSIVNKPWS